MIDPERKIQAIINRLEDEKNVAKKCYNDTMGREICTGIVQGLNIAIDRLELLIK